MMARDYKAPRNSNDNPIAHARIDKGMTQLQLANAVGVMQQQISAWECGRFNVPIPVLVKIAAVLDVDMLSLVGDGKNGKKRSTIADMRRKKGYTQAQFAKELGLSQAQISNYETGVYEIPAETLKKMADTLEVPVETIRTEDD